MLIRKLALGVLCLCMPLIAVAVVDENVVLVETGTQSVMPQPLSVIRVAVGNPALADVSIINRRELLVTGKAEGVTSLLVWYQAVRESREYRIVVTPVNDPRAQPAADPGLAMARIDAGQLGGVLPNLSAHAQARNRARSKGGEELVDNSAVDINTQVLTEIKIAELSRTTLRQFGFNFVVNKLNTTAALVGPGSLGGIDQAGPGEPFALQSPGLVPLQDAFNLVVGDASRNVLGFLSLLEGKGLVRTLAEPSLVASSGQTASFLAGGEFPVPISQGDSAGISIEYKEFGVRVLLTPTVLGPNRVALKVAPEVSELDFSVGVQVGGVQVPALTVRRTDTTVELGDGESFVISGLVSRNLLANVDKVPFLGSLPVLGAFFKSTRYNRNEKELIMVVTPHLIRPLKAGAKTPPLPGAEYDDYDPGAARLLFLESGKFATGLSR